MEITVTFPDNFAEYLKKGEVTDTKDFDTKNKTDEEIMESL